MGAVSGLLGTGGGASGTGFATPQQANIVSPATKQQADELYGQSQAGIAQQQQFLQALQAQQGIANQSSVYNQLQAMANGQGPNVAQTQLQNATGANVANQAALMAGQRGASANPGMIARQAAQQGANVQQQAVGQGAALQAQQSANAVSAMGNLATQQVGQQQAATTGLNNTVQGEQSNILNSIGGQNNANVGMQSNINSANAGMAGIKMGGQANMIGNVMSGIGAAASLPKPVALGGMITHSGVESPLKFESGGQVPAFGTIIAAPMAPAAPAPVAAAQRKGPMSKVAQHFMPTPGAAPMDGASQMGQTIGNGIGTVLKGIFGADEEAAAPVSQAAKDEMTYAQMKAAPGFDGNGFMMGDPGTGQPTPAPMAPPAVAADMSPWATRGFAQGGKVPTVVSPEEHILKPNDVRKVAEGKDPLSVGKTVPGKAKVKGNSYANDVVPMDQEPGSVVIPKSVMESKDPHKAAADFVKAVLNKQRRQLPKRS